MIRCLPTNKVYIGSSKNIEYRLNFHKRRLKNGKHRNPYLQNAWSKYNEKQFKFDILEECYLDVILDREKHYIEEYDACNRKCGFNIVRDPNRPTHTQEIKDKISATLNGRIIGKEWRNKMSLSRIGSKNPNHKSNLSDERKLWMSKRISGEKNYNAILMESQVRVIKYALSLKRIKPTIKQLATLFGVSYNTIWHIRKGDRWGFVRIKGAGG